jgi:ADP-heptose:LPS heptosyltransferase
MGWKRSLLETYVSLSRRGTTTWQQPPADPKSIFVLRNNDIGDLLVITPLFETLHRRFPKARIIAGIGYWNRAVLERNPYVNGVVPVNAPWHNQRIPRQGWLSALRYIRFSSESRQLAAGNFEIGIDVLGSGYGSLLLMKAEIPYRLGVRGYAGGHTGASAAIPYNPSEHVGRMALRFAEKLGATELPEVRPQLYLTKSELRECGIVVAPGGGYQEKRWPPQFYRKLLKGLSSHETVLMGSPSDQQLCAGLAEGLNHVENLAGRLSLCESFGRIAGAQMIICNSSMAMHAAAAFRKPCAVLLGDGILDAEQHAVQWAYPETMVFGKTAVRSTIYTPGEVLNMLRDGLAP